MSHYFNYSINPNKQTGVYCIRNIVNNKVYIGSSIDIERRFYCHKYHLNKGIHINDHLQKSWNKYGENNFEFSIVEELKYELHDDEDDYDFYQILLDSEQWWIDYFQSSNSDFGYNISAYASGSGGYQVTEETKEKIRQSKIGTHASDDTKKKLSEQRKGELNNFFGCHHTEESKQKMRDFRKTYTPTERQLKSLELGRGIKYYTEETYKKLRELNQGENSATSKISEKDVLEILSLLKNKVPYKDISKDFGISFAEISRIKNRKRWEYLYDKYPELYT